MKRLYINGNEIELGDAKILQTFEAFDLSNRNVKASYTNSIDIPKTASNVSALTFYGTSGSNSTIPYGLVTVDLYDASNQLIRNGSGILNEYDDNYKLRVIYGNNVLFDAIGEDLLSDLDWSDLDHVLTDANVVLSQLNSSGYVYPILGNGSLAEGDYKLRTLHVFTKTILAKIESEYGVTIDGAILGTDDKILNEIVACTSKKDYKFQARTEITYPQATPPYTAVTLLEFSEVITSTNAITYLGSGSDQYQAEFSGEYTFSIKANGYTTDPNILTYIVLEIVGGTTYRFDNNTTEPTVDDLYMVTNKYDAEFTLTINIEKGDTFNFSYLRSFEMEIGAILTLENLNISTLSGTTITVGDFVPKVKIKDFLQDFFKKYALLSFPTETGVYLATLNDVISGDYGSVDWTNKFHALIKTESKLLSNKVNNLKYSSEDIGSTTFDTFIDYLTPTGDFITLKGKAVEDILLFEGVEFGLIDVWDTVVEDDGTKTRRFKGSDDLYCFYRYEDVIDTVIETFAQSDPLHWDLLLTYYSDYITIARKPTVHEVIMNLSILDIMSLDFRKVVYVNQLGGYFLLSKIEAWQSGELCKVTLIKTNKTIPTTVSGGIFDETFAEEFN